MAEFVEEIDPAYRGVSILSWRIKALAWEKKGRTLAWEEKGRTCSQETNNAVYITEQPTLG